MPLLNETEEIVHNGKINSGNTEFPDKFAVYAWEGKANESGSNQKIAVPLTVVAENPTEESTKCQLFPRITLGKPVAPEPPLIMGGGVPILGISASSRIDAETKQRSDEYQLLRSQALPTQESFEYKAYPEDCHPARTIHRKKQSVKDAVPSEQIIYHSYTSIIWQYLGLHGRLLACLDKLHSSCIAHYCSIKDSEESSHAVVARKTAPVMGLNYALRYRVESFISQGRISLLIGNLQAVMLQLNATGGLQLSGKDIQELINFQEFEKVASLDRGLPVLYLYPFSNLYEVKKAEKASGLQAARYDLQCLMQPEPLQQLLEVYADPALSRF